METQDTGLSIFGEILADIIGALPDAIAAIIVDWECEMVDAAGRQDRLDVALAAAHWGTIQLMIQRRLEDLGLGPSQGLQARFRKQAVVVVPISEEYFVVLLLEPAANLAHSTHVLRATVPRLLEQM